MGFVNRNSYHLTMQSSDLNLLVVLDALLQESSVTRAARRLGLSTPAVSHSLAKLRTRFDDELLVRAGRGMVLTPRAESLKPQVRDAVATAEQVFASPEAFDLASYRNAFTVSVTDYVTSLLGKRLDASVRAEAPLIDLRFVLNTHDDGELLRSGQTDLAIGIYGQLGPELKMKPVLTERLVCAVRAGHPLEGRRLSLSDYVRFEHVQVAPRGRPGGYVDRELERRSLSRRVSRAVPFFLTGLQFAAESDAILTAPERLIHTMGKDLGLRPMEPPLELEPYTLSMIWHPRFDSDPGHAWLRGRIAAAFEEVGGIAHAGARRGLTD